MPLTSEFPTNEKDFEYYCRDVVEFVFKRPLTHLYGRRGQSQSGIDIYTTEFDIVVQCKYKNFPSDTKHIKSLKKELENESLKALKSTMFGHKINTFILATNFQKNDTELQNLASQLSDRYTNEYQRKIVIDIWFDDFLKHNSPHEKWDSSIYLQKILNQSELKNANQVYVKLLGQGYVPQINQIASEIINQNYSFKFNSFDDDDDDDDDEYLFNGEEQISTQRTSTVIEIAENTDAFVLIGVPGSGKTTTLQKLLFQQAEIALSEPSNSLIPVLIKANLYKPEEAFEFQIAKNIGLLNNISLVKKHLERGLFYLFIDGVNEISEQYKTLALNELQSILTDYPLNKFIISTRKFGFTDILNIPIFELKSLDEPQIKEYITNYFSFSKKEFNNQIWLDLQLNKNIVPLMNNPLTLFMTVFVLVEKSKIPENRGLLYKGFIEEILKREGKKTTQINGETKNNALAYLAYQMRKEGVLALHKETVKGILIEIIGKLGGINGNVNDLQTQLIDNHLLQCDSDDNVTFLHETYLEYFASLELFRIFILNNQLSIDVENDKWIEPLLMCSDLFRDEKTRNLFFHFLFVGNKKVETKPIRQFDKSDICNHLVVGCKIAYNLRNIQSTIYEQAERYLLNYLTLWVDYNSRNQELIDIRILFEAVGALSSAKVFKMVLFSDNWVKIWLYSEDTTENHFESEQFQKQEKLFLTLCSAIMDNLSDTTTFFHTISIDNISKEIGQQITYYKLSQSVKKRLSNLINILVFNIPIEKLIILFNETLNKELLFRIAVRDLNFFIERYNIEEWGYKQFFKLLLKHKNVPSVKYQLLHFLRYKYEEIDSNLLRGCVMYLCQNMAFSKNYDDFTELFETVTLTKSSSLINTLLKEFIRTPFKLLPEKIQDSFEKEFNNSKILIKDAWTTNNGISASIDFLSEKIQYLDFCNNLTKKNAEDKYIFLIKDSKNIIGKITDFYGQINNTDCQILINTYIKHEFEYDNLSKLYFITTKKTHLYAFRGFDKDEINNLKCIAISSSSNLSGIPKSGLINISKELNNKLIKKRIQKDGINYSRFNGKIIHPDLILNNNDALNIIRQNINSAEILLKGLGLTYLFHSNLEDIEYAIITYMNNYFVHYYLIKQKIFDNIFVLPGRIDDYKINQIVVVEDNNTLGILDEEDRSSKIGFIEGVIINVNTEKQFGFINHKVEDEKDFFFHFENIDFTPQIGNRVSFIPSINPASKYNDSKIALKIKLINQQRLICKITNVKYRETYIEGWASDVVNLESLYFSVPNKEVFKIVNLSTEIKSNQLFQYLLIRQNEKGAKIRLIEFLS